MLDIGGALRRPTAYKKTEVVLDSIGPHRGYWLGLGSQTETASVKCKRCNGRRAINGEECRTCNATGRADETKVALIYQMGKDLFQEEWVNFVLSAPGKKNDGTPKSASTFYLRLKSFSGGIADDKELAAWYKALPKEPTTGLLVDKIPITMTIDENDNGSAFVISSVRKYQKQQTQPQPKEDPEFSDEGFN